MKRALIALVACSRASPPPPPPPPPAAKPVAKAIPVLDQPAWPAGDKLVVHWTVASERSADFDPVVELVIGSVRRRFPLPRVGDHVWPGNQSVCERRLGIHGGEVLTYLERSGDVARLAFTKTREEDETLARGRVTSYNVRRAKPDLLELWVVKGVNALCPQGDCHDRTLLVRIPIPAHVSLDETIEDTDHETNMNTMQSYGCGLDEGLSP